MGLADSSPYRDWLRSGSGEVTGGYFHNKLPPTYKTWLEFYDALPSLPDGEKTIRVNMMPRYDRTVRESPSFSSETVPVIRIELDVDFLLARVAEELLPLRLSDKQLYVLRAMMETAYSSHTRFFTPNDADLLRPYLDGLYAAAQPPTR